MYFFDQFLRCRTTSHEDFSPIWHLEQSRLNLPVKLRSNEVNSRSNGRFQTWFLRKPKNQNFRKKFPTVVLNQKWIEKYSFHFRVWFLRNSKNKLQFLISKDGEPSKKFWNLFWKFLKNQLENEKKYFSSSFLILNSLSKNFSQILVFQGQMRSLLGVKVG